MQYEPFFLRKKDGTNNQIGWSMNPSSVTKAKSYVNMEIERIYNVFNSSSKEY